MAREVAVIGAGAGGLAAAIELARAGCAVTLIEKNATLGGRLRAFSGAGFRWDMGPVAMTARDALERIFRRADRDLADYLRWRPLDPMLRCFFADGTVFDLHRDWSRLSAQIAQLEPADVEGYLRFLAFAARIYRDSASDGTGARRVRRLKTEHRGHMRGAISRYIRSPKLRQILGHFAASVGGSPYQTPASYCGVAHQILSGGIDYPRGGNAEVGAALGRLAQELGVRVVMGCAATQILAPNRRVTGVVHAGDAQPLKCDAVVSNLDLVSTARDLLPAGAVSPVLMNQLRRSEPSASAFVMMLGARGAFPQLAHHNVFFSAAPKRASEQIFSRGVMPDDPTLTLTLSCRSDPQHAPIQQENWLLRTIAPALSEKYNWASELPGLRDRILTRLMARYNLDLRDRLRLEWHVTPADFQRELGAWRGALYGASPHSGPPAAAVTRLGQIKGLYFADGGVVPRGGLERALRSGELVAAALREDFD